MRQRRTLSMRGPGDLAGIDRGAGGAGPPYPPDERRAPGPLNMTKMNWPRVNRENLLLRKGAEPFYQEEAVRFTSRGPKAKTERGIARSRAKAGTGRRAALSRTRSSKGKRQTEPKGVTKRIGEPQSSRAHCRRCGSPLQERTRRPKAPRLCRSCASNSHRRVDGIDVLYRTGPAWRHDTKPEKRSSKRPRKRIRRFTRA